jgi:hypothetical protein
METTVLIQKSIEEIREFLDKYHAELRTTQFPDTYLIKFNPETISNDPDINHLRGLIFNHKTHQIYAMTYPVPCEFKDLDAEEQDLVGHQIASTPYTVQEALDGTLLRLWYHPESGRWIVSTNGKEDAHEAFWMNNVSFYDQLVETMPCEFDGLNQNHVYMFLLCHPLNVIVVNHQEAKVYHVATYDRTTLEEVDPVGPVPRPAVLPLTVEEVRKNVLESRDKPVGSAGYMVIQKPDAQGRVHRYRFENLNYTLARELRGDSNNVNFIILGHMLNRNPQPLADFLQYYPIYQPVYYTLHHQLELLIPALYQEYGQRFKQRLNIWVDQRHHKFLDEIHTQVYLAQLRQQKRTVQLADIQAFVCQQPTAKVLFLLGGGASLQ